MSNTPVFPIVPGGDDRQDGDGLVAGADEDRPLDTDLDPDSVDSAEADERAATEGTRGE